MLMLAFMYFSEVSVGRYSPVRKFAPLSYRRYIPSRGRRYHPRCLVHTAVHQNQLPIPPVLDFLEGKADGACSNCPPRYRISGGSSSIPSLMATLLVPILVLSFSVVYRIHFTPVAFELTRLFMLVRLFVWKKQCFCMLRIYASVLQGHASGSLHNRFPTFRDNVLSLTSKCFSKGRDSITHWRSVISQMKGTYAKQET
jgi:hypothetical protein